LRDRLVQIDDGSERARERRYNACAAETLELTLLQDAQQLGFADGVNSVISSRKRTPPQANSICPGFDCCALVKGAPLKSEELRLDELIWRRRTVDGDEWSTASWRRGVNEARDNFFSCARFALQGVATSVAATRVARSTTVHHALDVPTKRIADRGSRPEMKLFASTVALMTASKARTAQIRSVATSHAAAVTQRA
jgi:hypothetical protein